MPIPNGAHTCGTCHGEGFTMDPPPTPSLLERIRGWWKTFSTPRPKEKPAVRTSFSKKSESSFAESIVSLFILVPIGIVLGGFVLSKLWGWFIVPVFAMLPTLTVAQAVGVNTVLGFFKLGLATTIYDEEVTIGIKTVGAILIYLLVLLFGWIIHLFIG